MVKKQVKEIGDLIINKLEKKSAIMIIMGLSMLQTH